MHLIKYFILLLVLLLISTFVYAGPPSPKEVSDEAYNATTWNGVGNKAPSKNAIRDKIETLGNSAVGAWGASSEITISVAGVAALTGQGYFTIDTNADGATDDLVSITGLDTGDEIIIAPNNDARTVVVKNGANIILCRSADFTMNNTKDRMVLQHIGSNVMVEISRSSGGD